MKREVTGKHGRRIRMLTSCEGRPVLSGPGAWHVSICDVCRTATQVAQWQEKNGEIITLCQICFS